MNSVQLTYLLTVTDQFVRYLVLSTSFSYIYTILSLNIRPACFCYNFYRINCNLTSKVFGVVKSVPAITVTHWFPIRHRFWVFLCFRHGHLITAYIKKTSRTRWASIALLMLYAHKILYTNICSLKKKNCNILKSNGISFAKLVNSKWQQTFP